jgi:hypothetical protein
MSTHVFIVDSTTFKVHLEYLFAGTGAKDYTVDFNGKKETALAPAQERLLVSMIADASRVRKGDKVIFYLQQTAKSEGQFFGLFTATEDGSVLDSNGSYLMDELGKSLTFRAFLVPDKVYPLGVTEWEALDEIKNIRSPHQMLWSLIYRKLKGNRGNTMITEYESERLCQLIRQKNKMKPLEAGGQRLSYDSEKQEIYIADGEKPRPYAGGSEAIEILPRLIEKLGRGQAPEVHLQAYITANIGKNAPLDKAILGDDFSLQWIGNEVSCGVGMQRIDVLLSAVINGQRTLFPIELKAVAASADNIRQIQRYVDWLEQYYLPNLPCDIQPVLLTRRPRRADVNLPALIEQFNNRNQNCLPLKCIEFEVLGDTLSFEEVSPK